MLSLSSETQRSLPLCKAYHLRPIPKVFKYQGLSLSIYILRVKKNYLTFSRTKHFMLLHFKMDIDTHINEAI